MKIEISNLKKADSAEREVIYRATLDEIKEFGYPESGKKYRGEDGIIAPREYTRLRPKQCENCMLLFFVFIIPFVFYISSGKIYSLVTLTLAFLVSRFLLSKFDIESNLVKNSNGLLDEFMTYFPHKAVNYAPGWWIAAETSNSSDHKCS